VVSCCKRIINAPWVNCQGHVLVWLDQRRISSESQLFCSSLPCVHSVYLPFFTLRFLLCVSVSIFHEACTVVGSTIEVSAQKAIDVIGWQVSHQCTWFLKYQQALIFSQVFPIFRNPLDIIFYHWQVIIILCCCIFPRLATSYHMCSSRPFQMAILGQVRINNVACGVPKQMVWVYIFPILTCGVIALTQPFWMA